jgi:hypothetical protein
MNQPKPKRPEWFKKGNALDDTKIKPAAIHDPDLEAALGR